MTTMVEITAEEAKQKIKSEDILIVDVRDEEDFAKDAIPNAIHLDQYNICDFTEETPKDQPILIYCYKGKRSKQIAQRLICKGFTKIYNLEGGLEAW
jgi:thiosulfate sulfurtransferase